MEYIPCEIEDNTVKMLILHNEIYRLYVIFIKISMFFKKHKRHSEIHVQPHRKLNSQIDFEKEE